ncbi:MAG: TonB-dependent siderophore receptor [Hyphomicrobiales bacterium]|nr:TonB-dependent siderophore receptor [Hyphomicrobiales bacterium]
MTDRQSRPNTCAPLSSNGSQLKGKADYIRSSVKPVFGRTSVGLGVLLLSAGLSAAQEADQAIDLPTIDISGGRETSYNPGETSLARVPTPLIDTPQSVSVVPQQVIKDQKATTLVEALRNVPGITFNAGEGGTQGDNINIRGFTARNDIYRDGIREPGWYTRDSFSIDSVEVLKGPSSFAFGRGSTGGIVNIKSKLPTFTNFTEIEASGSSAPGARAIIDVNRVISDNVAARVVLLGNDTDVAGRNYTNTKRFGFAPSVTIKATDRTTLTFSYIYQKDDNIPDYGIPQLPSRFFGRPAGTFSLIPTSRSTWYGQLSPGMADTEQVDAHIATAKIEHKFNDKWTLTNAFRYSYVDRFTRVRGTQVNATNIGTINPITGVFTALPANAAIPPLGSLYINNANHFQNATKNELLSNQTDLVGRFTTGAFSHTAVVGAEVSREHRDNLRTNIVASPGGVGGGSPVSVLFPDPFPADPGVLAATSASTKSSASTAAVYVSDQIKINKWFEILAGARFDHYSAEQDSATITRATGGLSAPSNLTNKVNKGSWRGGVVFHPSENTSIYAVYGTSFNPPSEFTTITAGQQALGPVKNETFEIGAKADLLEGRLSINGAVFRTNKMNDIELLSSGPPAIYQPVGNTRVQGFEIGVTGKLTDQWNVFAGYTYLDGKIVDSVTLANVGHETAQTPKNSFALFSTYDISPKWTVGAGSFFVDDRYSSAANTLRVPSYWRFDAMSTYRVSENLTMQLNLYNLANTTNFESIAGAGWAVPGPGRSGTLTARVRF